MVKRIGMWGHYPFNPSNAEVFSPKSHSKFVQNVCPKCKEAKNSGTYLNHVMLVFIG